MTGSRLVTYGYDGWDTAKPNAVGSENFDAWATSRLERVDGRRLYDGSTDPGRDARMRADAELVRDRLARVGDADVHNAGRSRPR